MLRSLRLLSYLGFTAFAVATTGCAGTDDAQAGSDDSSAAALVASATFKADVTHCQAVERKADNAQSTVDMVRAEVDVRDCYSTTLRKHAARIDAIRGRNGGLQIAPATATAAAYFADYRAGHAAGAAAPATLLCDILDAASSNFGGTLQRVERAGCEAATEIRMAKLVGSETTLPGGSTPLTSADGTADDLHQLVAKLVAQMIENTPGGDSAALGAQVQETFDGVVAASTDLCGLLEDAGQMGGGTGARQLQQICTAKAIGLVVAEVGQWVDDG